MSNSEIMKQMKSAIGKMDKECFKASQDSATEVMNSIYTSINDDDQSMKEAKMSGAIIAAIEFVEMCQDSNTITVTEK